MQSISAPPKLPRKQGPDDTRLFCIYIHPPHEYIYSLLIHLCVCLAQAGRQMTGSAVGFLPRQPPAMIHGVRGVVGWGPVST